MRHWRTHLPTRFAQITDPETFFTELGEQAAAQVEELTLQLTGDDPPTRPPLPRPRSAGGSRRRPAATAQPVRTGRCGQFRKRGRGHAASTAETRHYTLSRTQIALCSGACACHGWVAQSRARDRQTCSNRWAEELIQLRDLPIQHAV